MQQCEFRRAWRGDIPEGPKKLYLCDKIENLIGIDHGVVAEVCEDCKGNDEWIRKKSLVVLKVFMRNSHKNFPLKILSETMMRLYGKAEVKSTLLDAAARNIRSESELLQVAKDLDL